MTAWEGIWGVLSGSLHKPSGQARIASSSMSTAAPNWPHTIAFQSIGSLL